MEILKDKATKDYSYISRYTGVPYYYHTVDDKYIYGTTSQLSTDTPYVVHIVSKLDTLDSLALKYYNNPTYYWVIADFNSIQDPFSQLEEGRKLKIPTLSSIKFVI